MHNYVLIRLKPTGVCSDNNFKLDDTTLTLCIHGKSLLCDVTVLFPLENINRKSHRLSAHAKNSVTHIHKENNYYSTAAFCPTCRHQKTTRMVKRREETEE